MAIKQIQALHYRTPYSLMRVAEFNKFFDSTRHGSMFRILTSEVCRTRVSGLQYINIHSYLYALCRQYEKGSLCSFFTDAELADVLQCTTRYIEDLRKMLAKAKLIRFHKWKDGFIYEVGTVLRYSTDDGYSVGEEHEALYIDQWYTFCEKDRTGFRLFLVENFAAKKDVTELLEDLKALKAAEYKPQPVALNEEAEKIDAELRNIFRTDPNYISENQDLAVSRSRPLTQQKSDVVKTSIEVLSNEPSKDRVPSGNSHGFLDDLGVAPKTEAELKMEEGKLILEELVGRMKSLHRSVLLSEYIKMKKEILATGVTKQYFDDTVNKIIPEQARYDGSPVFSFVMGTKRTGAHHAKVGEMVLALRMDVTGTTHADGQGGAIGKISKDLLSSYSFEQIVWSMKRIATTERLRVGLRQTMFAVKTILVELDVQWKALQSENQAEELRVAQKAISREESIKQDAELAARFNKRIEETVAAAVPVVLDYEALIAGAGSSLIRDYYIRERNRARNKG